jgi:hypothetical protein
MENEKLKIHYSSCREIKDYLEMLADRYNMTISGILTMIIMQHKFQNETLEKFDNVQSMLEKIEYIEKTHNSEIDIKTFSL